MAYQVMTSQDSPPYVVIAAGRPDLPPILNGMEVWQIILIVVGSIFLAIAIGAIVCYRRREQIRAWALARKQRKAEEQFAAMNQYSVKHPQPQSQTHVPVYRSTQDVVNNLAVPPPPPLRQTQNQYRSTSSSREDPILLQNARRS